MLEQLFASNSHDNLTRGREQGQAQLIKVDLIDEDKDQPRKSFNQDELKGLAASIRDIGVIQPIGVRPPVNGRNLLVFGARRLRAAKLAAIRKKEDDGDLTVQVIENQHRVNLSNAEL